MNKQLKAALLAQEEKYDREIAEVRSALAELAAAGAERGS